MTGRVTDIDTDLFGRPYITMGGTNGFMEPQFAFNKDTAEELAKVKKGMRLTLICEGNGDVAKTPMSEDCRILHSQS